MTTSIGAGRVRLILAGVVAAFIIVGIVTALSAKNSRALGAGCAPDVNAGKPSQTAGVTEFAMPHLESDLMFPAVDPAGDIWFGEMHNNRLGRFHPATNTFTEWHPAGGHSGIMGLAADKHGDIWYAELAANHIGRFTPSTCQFATFAAPQRAGHGAGPNGLALAPDGRVWVTLESDDRVAVLNPTTGAFTTYDLPNPNPSQIVFPYGIAVDQKGIVWFAELSSNALVRLDPTTGKMTTHAIPTANAQPDEIAIAPDGTPWFCELMGGKIGRVDPTTGTVTEIPVPTTHGPVPELYDITVTAKGIVWVTSSGANALFRYDPAAKVWAAVPLPHPGSTPFGIVAAPDGGMWFTEGAVEANRIGLYREG